jgi:hypothetical protein
VHQEVRLCHNVEEVVVAAEAAGGIRNGKLRMRNEKGKACQTK